MTASPAQPTWSRSQWLGTLTLVFCIQGVFIFLFAERTPKPSRPPTPAPRVRYVPPQQWFGNQITRSLTRDPALLTRVHERSFSGALWNDTFFPAREYEAWTEPPRFLNRSEHQAGAALKQHIRLHEQQEPSVVTLPAPVLSEGERPEALPRLQSSLLIVGGIRSRAPDRIDLLPVWVQTNYVSPTVLTVGIDRQGWAQSVIVASNSIPQADAFARNWIRKTRFKPIDPDTSTTDAPLTWGDLTFRWATRPATSATTATNRTEAP